MIKKLQSLKTFLSKQLKKDLKTVKTSFYSLFWDVYKKDTKDTLYYASILLSDGTWRTPCTYVFSDKYSGLQIAKSFLLYEKASYERVDLKPMKFVKKVVLKTKLKMDTNEDFVHKNYNQSLIDKVEQNSSQSLICLTRFTWIRRNMPGFYIMAFLPTSSVEKAIEIIQLGLKTNIPVRTLYLYRLM
jgi:hypothetical protein